MIKFNSKIILIALIFILVMSAINIVYAIEDTDFYTVSPTVQGENTEFSKMISSVLGIIVVVGIIVAVGGIMILGIQTMTASAQEKAIYKQKLIPFIIGFIILITSTAIVGAVWKLAIGQTETPSPSSPSPNPDPDPWDPTPLPY